MERIIIFALIGLLTFGVNTYSQQKIDARKFLNTVRPPREITSANIERLNRGIAWDVHPDQKTLLLSWSEDAADSNPDDEIAPANYLHTMNLDNRSIKKISESEIHQGNASYSPDGKTIVFMENTEAFSTFTLNNSPNAVKKRLAEEEAFALPQPAWSPDGNLIANAYGGKDNAKIIVYGTDGSKKHVLSDDNLKVRLYPYFYDNDTLLFVAGHTRNKEDLWIAAQDLSGANLRKIASGIRFSVSPNKTMLAYISRTTSAGLTTNTLKVASFNSDLTLGPDIAATEIGSDSRLAWSPDGSHLLYASGSDLWLFSPESGANKQLTSAMHSIVTFMWLDNKTIVFSGVSDESAQAKDYSIYTYLITLS